MLEEFLFNQSVLGKLISNRILCTLFISHELFFVPQQTKPEVRHEKTDVKVFVVVIYQKKDGSAWPCPSYFWYDTDFLEFESSDFIDNIL